MGAHAGALVVGDARLLALPVRSFKGTFAFVTSPLLLRLAKRDLGVEATSFQMPPPMAAGSSQPRIRASTIPIPINPAQLRAI